MEDKSRNRFAVIIAIVLTAVVLYSFTFTLFDDTPPVGLAPDSATSGAGEEPTGSAYPAARVEVTPETVQTVIAGTLSRYRSYSRTVQIQYLDGGEVRGTLTASVFVDGGWTRVDLTTPSGVEHTIIGEDACYRWYDGGEEHVTLPVEEGLDDLAQRLPTYETVLELERDAITAAGYESRGGVACIYVETAVDALDYLERYWISLESGLLVAAETLKGGELVYRMEAYAVESPLAGDAWERFTLPDGTVLHGTAETAAAD